MSRNRESIVLGFTTLRSVCDPRGHDLLQVLEDEMLRQHDLIVSASGDRGVTSVSPSTPERTVARVPSQTRLTEADTHSRHFTLVGGDAA